MNFKQYLATLLVGLFVSSFLIIWSTFFVGEMNFFAFFVLIVLSFYFCFKFPRRSFLVFIMLIPLENIIITPAQFGIGLRPFQFLGAVLVISILALSFKKKSSLELLSFKRICLICRLLKTKDCVLVAKNKSFNWLDRLVFIFPIFAFLAIINSPQQILSAKLAIILVSFVVLYWLIRNFTQTRFAIIETLLFFIFGSIPVIFWSFYQALAKLIGWQDFQVFTARVNGTFTEPDWLGVYLTLMIAGLLWFRHLAKPDKSNLMVGPFGVSRIFGFLINVYFIVAFLVLILTVARSAWLGVVAVFLVYFAILFVDKFLHKTISFLQILKNALVLGFLGIVAIAGIIFTNLSTFHFANRATSSVSGEQVITISCEKKMELPDSIEDMEELEIFGCRHIGLEEIEKEEMNKMFVTTIMRPDPNVDIRKEIYTKTLAEVKKHPILGQGLGSAVSFLGTDDHGSDLNTSNILLEILFSMGIIATTVAIYITGFLISWSSTKIFQNKEHIFSSFILLSGVAIIVPNMFNSGLLLGIFWFWLAIVVSIFNVRKEINK
jgi:hypothetical protein